MINVVVYVVVVYVVNRSLIMVPYYHGLLRSTLRSTLRRSMVNYGILGSTRVKHVQTTVTVGSGARS